MTLVPRTTRVISVAPRALSFAGAPRPADFTDAAKISYPDPLLALKSDGGDVHRENSPSPGNQRRRHTDHRLRKSAS